MPQLAVVGQPISHSLSPRMQTAALRACGLAGEWTYGALELSPEEFAPAIATLAADEGWAGVNVTIPHKAAALAVAGDASEAARAIGAANTLSFRRDEGEAPAISADNTDAPAIIDSIAAAGREAAGARALVLGAGGSARAAVWALREAGAAVTVWNRTHARGAELAAEFGAAAVPAGESPRPERFDVLVNTTAVGLGSGDASRETGPIFKALGFGVDQLNDQQVVVDLAYGSVATELITAAKGRGARTVDGLEILVRQGARSFQIWTGLEPPLEAMEQAVRPPEARR
jgi:shikimate dehydrogenase